MHQTDKIRPQTPLSQNILSVLQARIAKSKQEFEKKNADIQNRAKVKGIGDYPVQLLAQSDSHGCAEVPYIPSLQLRNIAEIDASFLSAEQKDAVSKRADSPNQKMKKVVNRARTLAVRPLRFSPCGSHIVYAPSSTDP